MDATDAHQGPGPGADKAAWRAWVAARRRARTDDSRADARVAIVRHVLARHDGLRWSCVAAYEPLRTEPGSVELLAALAGRGVRVLVPVTLPDRDLDWTPWGSADGGVLGPDAIADADAVLVPASAVALDGVRLGRGGGSYDRALRRARRQAPRVALLFDDELVAALPADPWDVPVDAVVRPSGWRDLRVAAAD
ncbi:5-formyltetrahydrofolate cyclo-ligase [Jatrophihabitans fulvus]